MIPRVLGTIGTPRKSNDVQMKYFRKFLVQKFENKKMFKKIFDIMF